MKCKDINAGQLRHIITIEQLAGVSDGGGGQTNVWSTVLSSVPAKVKPVSGRERFTGDRLEMDVTHDILIRYSASVAADMRVKFRDRYMQIRSIINVEEQDIWLQLKCEEGPVT